MNNCCWIICFLVLSCFLRGYDASAGDSNPSYRACVEQCVKTGCVGERCFSQCKPSSDGSSLDGPLYTQEPLYLRWKQWDCQSDCHYHCMFDREKERAELGLEPLKSRQMALSTYMRYPGLLPYQHLPNYCLLEERASVVFSALNLAMHFHGWLSFFTLLHHKLPLKPDKSPFYDYGGLWYIYGLLAVIAWFCSAAFHSRDVDLTEKLDYTFAVALLGYSLILAIIRSFSLRGGPARVMVAAPLIAFTITHIFFLNLYKMDYGWNMKVCVIMGIAQLLIWSIWAGVTRHPSRWKLWIVVVGGGLAMLLEIFDFPPYQSWMHMLFGMLQLSLSHTFGGVLSRTMLSTEHPAS
ncbi:UNVERIFIED_CONTAM: Post-GPI attachment to proteins factor 3 [Sesamum radiatum]|uniref:Post-GPI attachment to proteins factor 3 n=1 Tax=Sesamum radiatum TaxID=300843 RepID=A0AAW2M2R1_SESRA